MGGARVTLWNFVVMIAAVFGVLHFLPQAGSEGNFYGFLAMFMLLFVTTGVGNGSTFRMIPVIFRTIHERLSGTQGAANKEQAIKNAGIPGDKIVLAGFTMMEQPAASAPPSTQISAATHQMNAGVWKPIRA